MTDAEISRRLALAIGWEESDIIEYQGLDYVGIRMMMETPCVRLFSFKIPTVIWPIAERFNCFPMRIEDGWGAWSGVCFWTADTAAKAVALAVIKHHEGSKT